MGPTSSPSPSSPPSSERWGGWRAAFGCAPHSLASYRIALGITLFAELALRFRYLHAFYSDEGTLPTRFLTPQIDDLYSFLCLHCRSGSLSYQRLLLSLQCLLALSLALGYRTKFAAVGSWFLYLSLTLRNTWLAFILDRYFHYLLFYAMFLPLGEVWSLDDWLRKRRRRRRTGEKLSGSNNDDDHEEKGTSLPVSVVTPATLALKLQIFWIYLDAGSGKYMDPLGGWTWNAYPLPALDTYARHTVAARYLYAMLGPTGLRALTPTVVWAELGAAPLALAGSWMGSANGARVVWIAVGVVWSLHLGIAATVRNTVLLSLVANVAWCVYLPPFASTATTRDASTDGQSEEAEKASTNGAQTANAKAKAEDTSVSQGVGKHVVSLVLISCFVAGSVWFEVFSAQCDQSMKHVWSTLLHNRWNVFVGAEEYVTWEIAPGRLADGSVVDVWSKSPSVNWEMPVSGTPCTSTARHGRWRSFPYLADFASEEGGEEGKVLWEYLCKEWDREHGVPPMEGEVGNAGKEGGKNEGSKRLVRYNFFMLQADVLPNMGFSATRKRLIRSHECGGKGRNTGAADKGAADTGAAAKEGGVAEESSGERGGGDADGGGAARDDDGEEL